MTFWQFLNDNWFWIFLFFLCFGGGMAKVITSVAGGAAKNRALKRENQTLRSLLEQRGTTPNALSAMTHEAELVDIVSRVQATDDAWSQLPKLLRQDIDGSLARYRHREVS